MSIYQVLLRFLLSVLFATLLFASIALIMLAPYVCLVVGEWLYGVQEWARGQIESTDRLWQVGMLASPIVVMLVFVLRLLKLWVE